MEYNNCKRSARFIIFSFNCYFFYNLRYIKELFGRISSIRAEIANGRLPKIISEFLSVYCHYCLIS
jgi:hypothetical protein